MKKFQPLKNQFKKLAEYKFFYKDKFSKCKSINEVLDTYVKYTDYDDILNELRLRYVSMYIFNSNLSKDKLSIGDIKSLLKEKLLVEPEDEGKEEQDTCNKIAYESINPDYKYEETMEDDILDEKFYIELKSHLEKEIPVYQQFENNITMDAILLSIFSHYGLVAIDSNIFIKTLLKLIKDMNFPKIENKDVKIYLKQRILNIIDTEFWEEDEKKIHRCEIFIVGRYIMVKTKDFTHISYKSGEGPIYISALPLSYGNRFSIYIEGGTSFAMNTMDKDKILAYFDYMNSEIMEEVNKKIEIVLKEVYNASLDLITTIQNFLNMMPLNILLDRDNYIAFEHLISFNSFVAQQLLDSNSEQRDSIIDKLKEDANFYNNIKYFIDENYKKLVKVAGKYINVPEEYHSSVIWKMIRVTAVQLISEYWNSEYGIFIKNDTQITDVDEYVDIYCRCLDIPISNGKGNVSSRDKREFCRVQYLLSG